MVFEHHTSLRRVAAAGVSRKMITAACPEPQSNGSLCWFWNRSYADSSQVFIRLQEIIARALNDFEVNAPSKILPRVSLSQEPLQKINRDVVVRLSREGDQTVDLIGHVNLLIK